MESEADMTIMAADWPYCNGQAALSWKVRLTWQHCRLLTILGWTSSTFMESEADMAVMAADWPYWDGQAALSWKVRLTW